MAAYGRAIESRELRAISRDRRTHRGAYEHGADGRRGDNESTHDDCERHILAERHRPSAFSRNFLESTRPLRTRDAGSLVDGSDPQNHSNAGTTTRGESAGDVAERSAKC